MPPPSPSDPLPPQNTATSFVSFLGTVVPIRTKTSRKLVSEDRRNNGTHLLPYVMCV